MSRCADIAVCVLLVLGDSAIAQADDLFPLRTGYSYEYTRSDTSGHAWTCWLAFTGQVTMDSQEYAVLQFTNYENDGVTEEVSPGRSTEDAVYIYNPDGEDYLELQKGPVGTRWVSQKTHDEYDWQVSEILAVGNVSVPYGTFAESYTIEKSYCVDPENLGIGQSPPWYEVVVPGIGIVKEIDYWNDDPPLTQDLVGVHGPGDANGDGKVDLSDLGILATNWGYTGMADPSKADFSFDGSVDLSDLGILATNWGTGTENVPEPATLGLLALGGLAALRRKGER